MTVADMIDVAKQVGADVPFCVLNKPAYVEGIGDVLSPFKCDPDFEVLLVKPRKGVSTKDAFAIVDNSETVHPNCDAMRSALIHNDYPQIIHSLGNSLEDAAISLVKDIRTVKNALINAGFDGVLMSGSGSTVFGITKDTELLEKTMEEMKNKKYFVRRTRILGGMGK